MAAPMPRAPPVTIAVLPASLMASPAPGGGSARTLEIGGKRCLGAIGPQALQGAGEGGGKALALRQLAVDVGHGEPGRRVRPGLPRGRLQAVPVIVVGGNRGAAVGFAITVAAPQ